MLLTLIEGEIPRRTAGLMLFLSGRTRLGSHRPHRQQAHEETRPHFLGNSLFLCSYHDTISTTGELFRARHPVLVSERSGARVSRHDSAPGTWLGLIYDPQIFWWVPPLMLCNQLCSSQEVYRH